MSNKHNKSQSGQILIIIVAGIIGLFAFAALAIDGGMVFFDRRSAQNAADAAALAGAYELGRDPWTDKPTAVPPNTLELRIKNAAFARALDNFYGNGGGNTVIVEYPPDAADIHFVAGDTEVENYVRVVITSTVDTSLIHFVYTGPVQNTVESVAHVTPPSKENPFRGAGLVALKPDDCDGIKLNGNLNANLIGGGMFVNSREAGCALNGPSGAYFVYSPSVTVVGGISTNIDLTSNLIVEPGDPVSGASDRFIPYPPDIDLDPPSCSSNSSSITLPSTDPAYAGISSVYEKALTPGRITAATMLNGKIWFQPGIYCVEVPFSANNTQMWGGNEVLFFLTGTSDPCKFTWNGGAEIKFSATKIEPYEGLLIFVDPRDFSSVGEGPMTFNGTGDSYIKGTVYGPTCSAKLNGTDGSMYQGQMVAYDIDMLGGGTFNMLYVSEDNYKPPTPAKVDLGQ